MKILYLNFDRGIPVLGDKGASVHVRAFVTAASRLGHEVVLACASLGEGNPPPPARNILLAYETQSAPAGGLDKTIQRELAKLAYDRAASARVLQALEAIKFVPDIIYERHALFHRAGVEIAARLGVPRLLEVNAPLVEEQRTFRGLCLETEARAAEIDSYRGADAVIAVSEAVCGYVSEVLRDSNRVHVVPNGVDLSLFAAADERRAEMRGRLGFGSGPVIGFIGSFKPWHGVTSLLEAFASLKAAHPCIHLLAVGDGPEREAVHARAAAFGLADQVVMPGRIPHSSVPDWLSAMDLTVAPYQPQPNFYFSPLKIVESMAAGRPVVAPNIGQIPELIEDGVTGRLYGADGSDLSNVLRELVEDPAALVAMGKRARDGAASFDWTAVVARILTLVPRVRMRKAAA